MIIGYLAGTFDLLNVGDLDVISQVRRRCDRLIVAAYPDEYVERVNGLPPVVPLSERIELIRHVRGVDDAVIHGETPIPAAWTVFRVAAVDAPPTDRIPGEVQIVPTRQSASPQLRAALSGGGASTVDDARGVA